MTGDGVNPESSNQKVFKKEGEKNAHEEKAYRAQDYALPEEAVEPLEIINPAHLGTIGAKGIENPAIETKQTNIVKTLHVGGSC